jgi:hypothetical protein
MEADAANVKSFASFSSGTGAMPKEALEVIEDT